MAFVVSSILYISYMVNGSLETGIHDLVAVTTRWNLLERLKVYVSVSNGLPTENNNAVVWFLAGVHTMLLEICSKEVSKGEEQRCCI